MKLLSEVMLLLLLSGGCKKYQDQPINGSWELRSVYGGLSGNGGGNFPPGNGIGYFFTDTTYKSYSNHSITDSGRYTISRGLNPQNNHEMNAIVLPNGLRMFYQRSMNTLTIYVGVVAADGVITTYANHSLE